MCECVDWCGGESWGGAEEVCKGECIGEGRCRRGRGSACARSCARVRVRSGRRPMSTTTCGVASPTAAPPARAQRPPRSPPPPPPPPPVLPLPSRAARRVGRRPGPCSALGLYNCVPPFRRHRRAVAHSPLCAHPCLLHTSDAADDPPCVDLGGRRITINNIPLFPKHTSKY